MEIEKRIFGIEFRQQNGSVNQKIIGMAACFNIRSATLRTIDGQEFQEELALGAFKDALTQNDCRSLINHNPDKILGRSSAGTLLLQETENGLAFEIDPPDTSYARDLKISMARKDVKECSFAFSVAPGGDSWTRDEKTKMPIRTIRQIGKLYDVSVVTYPAYDSTQCSLRSIGKLKAEEIPTFNDTEIRKMKLQIESII